MTICCILRACIEHDTNEQKQPNRTLFMIFSHLFMRLPLHFNARSTVGSVSRCNKSHEMNIF